MSEERYVYTITTGALPDPIFHRKQAKKVAEFFKGLDGLYGISPVPHPKGGTATLIAFDTLNNAKAARNLLRHEGNSVGKYIMKARVEKNGGLTVLGPAEGQMPRKTD